MSQITRCPSCATSFKVVADQLRISEGWVRCGQCKEVFDATAHLASTAESFTAPDRPFSFVQEHPPLDATNHGTETEHVDIHRQDDITRELVSPSPVPAQTAASVDALRDDVAATLPDAPLPMPLDVGMGGMLSAARAEQDLRERSIERESGWREAFAVRSADDIASESAPLKATNSLGSEHVTPVRSESVLAPWLRGRSDAPTARTDPVDVPLQDSGDALTKPFTPVVTKGAEESVSTDTSSTTRLSVLSDDALGFEAVAADTAFVERQARELAQEELDPIDRATNTGPQELKQSSAPPEIEREERRKAPPSRFTDDDIDDEEDFSSLDQEVGFVVAARHKALWRSPVVRALLSLVLLLCVLVLALQVAVHERDRIAAMDARTKPFLLMLCEAFSCSIAPQRQIAQVVIDSTSFNKLRGDSYQLVFVMKNRADAPVATPALELTLTDMQDQPVLRKVLLPSDFAAPLELAARGEWDASVSVVVTTGGARVIGYRLLAFYP